MGLVHRNSTRLIFLFVLLFTIFVVVYFLLFYQIFKAEVKYVAVKNGRIGYYVRGEGEPVLLIEGFGMSMGDWDPALLRSLSRNHMVILYDLRGVGASRADVSNLTVDEMVDDTISLLNSLHVQKTSIVGWSMGSLVAQELAITYPNRVNKLVLVSTFTADRNTIPASKVISDYFSTNLAADFVNRLVPIMFPQNKSGRDALIAYLQRRKNSLLSGESPTTPDEDTDVRVSEEQAMGQLQNADRTDDLKKITTPTLIIAGEEDEVSPVGNDKKVASLIPHAELKIIPQLGHAVLFADNLKVTQEILKFLDRAQ